MPDAVIIDAVRTPMGRYRGALAGVRPDDLAAGAIGAAVERTGIDPAEIVDVYLGAVNQASRAIRLGEGDLYLAGGVESMSRAPWVVPKPEAGLPRGSATMHDTALGWRLVNPRMAERHSTESMGETAENVAERYRIPREEQDRFALQSHSRAVAATREGRFADEL